MGSKKLEASRGGLQIGGGGKNKNTGGNHEYKNPMLFVHIHYNQIFTIVKWIHPKRLLQQTGVQAHPFGDPEINAPFCRGKRLRRMPAL